MNLRARGGRGGRGGRVAGRQSFPRASTAAPAALVSEPPQPPLAPALFHDDRLLQRHPVDLSPVPTHTMVVSDGATATAPIDWTPIVSVIGRHVVPLFDVFHKPPDADPA